MPVVYRCPSVCLRHPFTCSKKYVSKVSLSIVTNSWVKVVRIFPEFRILRPTFHRNGVQWCSFAHIDSY